MTRGDAALLLFSLLTQNICKGGKRCDIIPFPVLFPHFASPKFPLPPLYSVPLFLFWVSIWVKTMFDTDLDIESTLAPQNLHRLNKEYTDCLKFENCLF